MVCCTVIRGYCISCVEQYSGQIHLCPKSIIGGLSIRPMETYLFLSFSCTHSIEVNGKVVFLHPTVYIYIYSIYIVCVRVYAYINTDVAFHSTSSLLSPTYCQSPTGRTVGGKRLKPNGQWLPLCWNSNHVFLQKSCRISGLTRAGLLPLESFSLLRAFATAWLRSSAVWFLRSCYWLHDISQNHFT